MGDADPPDLFASGDGSVAGPTAAAPEFTAPSSAGRDWPAAQTTFADDYLLLRELGRGAFARVYLAHQRSLDRLVALKLSDTPVRGEGAVLAALEHEHIVTVFAEVRDPASGCHGLALQYVAGAHLGSVLAGLFDGGRRPAAGQDILDALDRLATGAVPFDPAALADREVYRRGGYQEVICRLAATLADALAVAHSRHVLHCDIKPANILIDRYGRPRLADFNVSVPLPADDSPAAPVGGTLAYMAPEHLAVFARFDDQPPVDGRADVYSLGLVVLEAATGLPPPAGDADAVGLSQVISAWTARQRVPEEWLRELQPKVPVAVWRVVRRCLAVHPGERYQTAAELGAALRGAADLMAREAATPPGSRLSRWAYRHPLVALTVFTFIPHLIGSAVNITYNRSAVRLTPAEADTFAVVTTGYNLAVYPACAVAAACAMAPVARLFRSAGSGGEPAAALDRTRQKALRLGRWGAGIAAVGWFPGGVIFPLALTDWAAGIDWPRFGHFAVSFVVSGLIALTYSYLGIQYVVVRGLYPRLTHPEQTAGQRQADANRLSNSLRWVPFAAAAVPLAGAVLQTAVAPAEFTLGFRLLITGLIVAGMVGLGVAIGVANRLRAVVRATTGGAE